MKGKIRTGCTALLFLLALSLGAPADMGGVCAVQTVQAAKKSKKTKKTGIVKKNGKIYYYTSEGKKVKNQWVETNGGTYYFTENGEAAIGGIKISGTVYVFNENGKLIKKSTPGKVKVGKYTFYVDQEGKATTGLFKIGKKLYYGGKDRGRLWTAKWKTINGSQYYFKKDHTAATGGQTIGEKVYVFSTDGKLIKNKKSGVVKVGKNSYYVDKNGIAKTGWFMVGKKLYYADSSGHLKKGKTVDGIKLNSKGYAESGTLTSAKIRVVKIFSSITNSSMTKAQKLRACWNYVCGGKFSYSTLYYPNTGNANWVYLCAENMFSRSAGNCYGFGCAFAVLAKEAGYNVEVIAGRVSGTRDGAADGFTRHCWVRINGLNYDPEGQYAGWSRGIYGTKGYPVAHQIIQVKKLY